jgi:hypothetical protein
MLIQNIANSDFEVLTCGSHDDDSDGTLTQNIAYLEVIK